MKQGLFAIALTASLAFAQEPPTPVRPTEQPAGPVATGRVHARTLVGYRDDAEAAGGGVFFTLDSAPGHFVRV